MNMTGGMRWIWQTRILPPAKTGSSANSVDQATEVSLFGAVRKWTDALRNIGAPLFGNSAIAFAAIAATSAFAAKPRQGETLAKQCALAAI